MRISLLVRRLSLFGWVVIAAPVLAQQSDHAHAGHDSASGDSPTGLSHDEMRGLRTGSGLGLAKAAELNHYPGPKHVLELTAELELTSEQRATAEALRAGMLAQAVPLGEQIIAAERQLDVLFSSEAATAESVTAQTAVIGELRGRLRAAHLTAHLGMRAVLTPEQIARYDELRGYTAATDS